MTLLSQTRALFLSALEPDETRAGKAYSFPDCVSMCVKREEGIYEVLTHDYHFAQEGRVVLVR